MAENLVFIENDMYVRNFLSSGALDGLIGQRSLKISVAETVTATSLRAWQGVCTRPYERSARNRKTVFSFNKLSILRYRDLSSTFRIKVRTGIPFGGYALGERLKAFPPIYDRYVRPGLLGRLEENRSVEAVILQERPKLVLFPITGVESTGYELIKLSRRYGFQTLFLVNGWDNLSSKTVFGALPDYLGLWGPQSLQDARKIHALPEERGILLGCARYEPYFRDVERQGSPFPFRYAIFAGATTPCDELTPLRRIDAELTRTGTPDLKIVYRPHPWRDKRLCEDLFEPKQFRHTILDPQLEDSYYSNKRTGQESVSSKSMPSLDYYPRLVGNAAFVISPMSSMSLEAALFDIPSIVLANDDGIHEMPNSLVAKFRHFDGAREVQGWYFVDELEELPEALRQVYERTRKDRPSTRHHAPGLSRAMQRYLFTDERSYSERLLQAVDRILGRVSAGVSERQTAHAAPQ